jgi:hypothetical protein
MGTMREVRRRGLSAFRSSGLPARFQAALMQQACVRREVTPARASYQGGQSGRDISPSVNAAMIGGVGLRAG